MRKVQGSRDRGIEGSREGEEGTREAQAVLAEATDVFGYTTYLDRVPERPGQTRHGSDNREELDRARAALTLAYAGSNVAIVSSGDPGVFAMAAAVFEAIETGKPEWREIDVEVIPGISAMFAAASRLGAPLGHDFCAISLSDLLTPWSDIERRLEAAAAADFVTVLYNPASRRRREGLERALAILQRARPPQTPVIHARNIGRAGETVAIFTLDAFEPAAVDMLSLLIVGSSRTRTLRQGCGRTLVYTPRGYAVP